MRFPIKMNSTNINILLFCLVWVSCRSVHVISKDEFETFRSTQSPGNFSKLRQDGVFNNVTKAREYEKYYSKVGGLGVSAKDAIGKTVYAPQIFFANGTFVTNENVFVKQDVLEQYKNGNGYEGLERWGTYGVSADTITLLVYKIFRNDFRLPRWDVKVVKYQGYILNDTTIINWRQVPPYPNRDKGQLDTAAQRLEFYYFPEKTLIDSNRVFK